MKCVKPSELPLSYRNLHISAADFSPDTHLQDTILLIWSNLSHVISAMIHRLGLKSLSHHPSFLTLPLAHCECPPPTPLWPQRAL